jgi:HPt (histidine-containing phosphotransfer) domain-containing protein
MESYLAKPVRGKDLAAMLARVAATITPQLSAPSPPEDSASPPEDSASPPEDSASPPEGLDSPVSAGGQHPPPPSEETPEQPETEVPAVDGCVLDSLMAQIGDDSGELLDDLITTYLNEGTGHVMAFSAAATSGDADTVRRIAHTLRSTSSLLGAMPLVRLLELAEDAARSGAESLPSFAEPVLNEYARVAESLEHRRSASWAQL